MRCVLSHVVLVFCLTCVLPSENSTRVALSLGSCRCNFLHILEASENWLASPMGVSCLDFNPRIVLPPPCIWSATHLLFFVYLLLRLPGEHDERGCGTEGTRLKLYMSGRGRRGGEDREMDECFGAAPVSFQIRLVS